VLLVTRKARGPSCRTACASWARQIQWAPRSAPNKSLTAAHAVLPSCLGNAWPLSLQRWECGKVLTCMCMCINTPATHGAVKSCPTCQHTSGVNKAGAASMSMPASQPPASNNIPRPLIAVTCGGGAGDRQARACARVPGAEARGQGTQGHPADWRRQLGSRACGAGRPSVAAVRDRQQCDLHVSERHGEGDVSHQCSGHDDARSCVAQPCRRLGCHALSCEVVRAA